MPKKTTNNLMVGAKVLIDWPIRWQGANPEFRDQLKAEAAAKEYYYGNTGIIMAYSPGEESGKEYTVMLDSTKELVHLHYGAMTITQLPGPSDSEQQIIALLTEIRDALIKPHICGA